MSELRRKLYAGHQGLPALFNLARDCRFASRQLADFLDRYLRIAERRLTSRNRRWWLRHESWSHLVASPENRRRRVPQTMRAAVYRGKGKVVVETLPVPEIGDGRSFDSSGGMRNLRHGHQKNSAWICYASANFGA